MCSDAVRGNTYATVRVEAYKHCCRNGLDAVYAVRCTPSRGAAGRILQDGGRPADWAIQRAAGDRMQDERAPEQGHRTGTGAEKRLDDLAFIAGELPV